MPLGFSGGPSRSCQWGGLLCGRCLGLVIVGLLLFGGGVPEAGGQGVPVQVHPDSRFWIQGEATTHGFTCVVERVEGEATLPPTREPVSAAKGRSSQDEQQTEALVRVPVKAFDCGNSRMTRDLKETLQMEEHPTIRLELVHATVGEPVPGRAEWHRIEVLGTLTIAGKKRLRRIQLTGRAIDDKRFRIRGCHAIRMTYFGIDPPTKALGLIEVKNRVEVQFDLRAHASSLDPQGAFDAISLTDRSRPSCSADGG